MIVIREYRLGLELSESLQRMYERVPARSPASDSLDKIDNPVGRKPRRRNPADNPDHTRAHRIPPEAYGADSPREV